jgi:hypothetical protein
VPLGHPNLRWADAPVWMAGFNPGWVCWPNMRQAEFMGRCASPGRLEFLGLAAGNCIRVCPDGPDELIELKKILESRIGTVSGIGAVFSTPCILVLWLSIIWSSGTLDVIGRCLRNWSVSSATRWRSDFQRLAAMVEEIEQTTPGLRNLTVKRNRGLGHDRESVDPTRSALLGPASVIAARI